MFGLVVNITNSKLNVMFKNTHFIIKLYAYWLGVLILLLPYFKLISPIKGDWTMLALSSTSLLLAVFLLLLIEIRDLLKSIYNSFFR